METPNVEVNDASSLVDLKFTNHSIDSSGDEVCRWREIIETRAGFCTVITSEFGETSTEHDIPIDIAMGRVKDWDKAD